MIWSTFWISALHGTSSWHQTIPFVNILDDVLTSYSLTLFSFPALLCPLIDIVLLTKLWGVWQLVGSRAWDVSTPYKGGMDDNNARAFEYGMGWQRQGICWNCISVQFSSNSKPMTLTSCFQHVLEYFT